MGERKHIAVVGSGAAGLTAAWLLARRHQVTVFEREAHAGGHVNTIVLEDGPDAGTPVDTGFIVLNRRNYPLLHRLFDQLGVAVRDSDMSFGYHDESTGLQYCGSGLNGLFAQRLNLLRPSFHGFLREIFRFFREAPRDLEAGRTAGLGLGEYLKQNGYGELFIRHHLIPMGAAIWSSSPDQMMQFPADAFLRFFHNHGLLTVNDRPQWETVVGGSHAYVQAMRKAAAFEVRLGEPVRSIRREGGRVQLATAAARVTADAVVVAAHADEALKLLADPSADERRLLGAWTYTRNRTVLHTDEGVMPPLRRVWSSWNYSREAGARASRAVSVTYHMNRLQGLRTKQNYFVTLNRAAPFRPGSVLREFDYRHPLYDAAALASQADLPRLNGPRQTWFCGSYFSYGFHEDAVKSGLAVARDFGIEL